MTTTTTARRMLAAGDPRHGSTRGANAGCQCYPCMRARSDYDCTRRRQIRYGTWQPYIDAEPVRQHLRHLSTAGLGWQRVAAITNLQNGTVSAILYGRPGLPPTTRIRPHIAEKILAVRATPDLLADGALVPATGTIRRLRALAALGYPVGHLGTRLPINPQWLQRIVTSGPEAVTNELARATVALYDELSLTLPPDTWVHQRARRSALKRGWAPPLAWDDATIDDPDAAPDLGEPTEEAVDEVLVRRALTGHAPLDDLNEAEQVALWQAWERQRRERQLDGPGLKDFARMHGVKPYTAERLRTLAHSTSTATTTDTAATGRNNERSAA